MLNPSITTQPEGRSSIYARIANYGNKIVSTWIVEPQLSYQRSFGKGQLESLLGATAQQNQTSDNVIAGLGYNSDQALKEFEGSFFFQDPELPIN